MLISIWPHPPYAWLDAVAMVPKAEDGVLDALLAYFEEHVSSTGVRQVLCSMECSDGSWMRGKLLARGFRVVARFLRYEKNDFHVPQTRTSQVRLKSPVPADLPEIIRVEKACFDPPWRSEEKMLRQMVEQSPCFRIALIDRAVAGFQYSTISDAGVGQFLHLAVDPRFRGLNVAKSLLADAIEFFESQRVSRVETRTEQHNARAQALFTSFGFQLTGSSRDVFAKDLALGPRHPRP